MELKETEITLLPEAPNCYDYKAFKGRELVTNCLLVPPRVPNLFEVGWEPWNVELSMDDRPILFKIPTLLQKVIHEFLIFAA